MALSVPVVLFLFKREKAALEVLDRIRLAAPRKLYLMSDQGRDECERQIVREVREAVEAAVDWPCEVVKNYASENRGVFGNIALGAKWVFEREPVAIFLEDDNVPEPTFFDYCAELLERYESDTRVLWVCGTNYLGEYEPLDGSSYVFSQHLLPCGWASWATKFTTFYDFNFELLESTYLQDRVRSEYADSRLYRQQMADFRAELARRSKNEPFWSWDYHMAWSLRVNGLYGISPGRNQIKNIGADEHSIHGGHSLEQEMTARFLRMDSRPLEFPLRHPAVVLADQRYEELITEIILYPLSQRIRAAARRQIGRMFRVPPGVSITKRIRSWFGRLNGASRGN